MFDKRLREHPYLYLTCGILFAAVALYSGYQGIEGLMTGDVNCSPWIRRGCWGRGHFPYGVYRLSEDPVFYVTSLSGWSLGSALCSYLAYFCWQQIGVAGGLSTSSEVRANNIIASFRGPIDNTLFWHLGQAIPRNWSAASLQVEHRIRPGKDGLFLTIIGPEGQRQPVHPTHQMYEAATDLFYLFERHGAEFKTTTYLLTADDDRRHWRQRMEILG